MIAETREKLEREQNTPRTVQDGGVYNVEQKLQSYLRDKYTPETVRSTATETTNLLAQVAKDWCLWHNEQLPDEQYMALAKEAISNYLNNWEGKKQGTDNRGKRFGKSW